MPESEAGVENTANRRLPSNANPTLRNHCGTTGTWVGALADRGPELGLVSGRGFRHAVKGDAENTPLGLDFDTKSRRGRQVEI
jgi:hypothetical protein